MWQGHSKHIAGGSILKSGLMCREMDTPNHMKTSHEMCFRGTNNGLEHMESVSNKSGQVF